MLQVTRGPFSSLCIQVNHAISVTMSNNWKKKKGRLVSFSSSWLYILIEVTYFFFLLDTD